MLDPKEKRIGIFEYDWTLYSFVKDFAIMLAEAGYIVDIFQKDPLLSPNFSSSDNTDRLGNVRIINFHIVESLVYKIIRKIKKIISRIDKNYLLNPKNLLDRGVLRKSKRIFDANEYICLIGIEKKGLIWAGLFARMKNLPLVYYSLELYIEDHPGMAAALKTREFSSLRIVEKSVHQNAGATIIQDPRRADVLMKYNQVESTRIMYLPISVRGSIIKKSSDFFVRNLMIHPAKKVLLYYGMIQDARFSTAMVRMADELNGDTVLVLHGYGETEHLSKLQVIANAEKVRFSLNLVPDKEITTVISSARIGLALYLNNNSNDRLTAFSSVKVAYYMQCGVPVIAFHSESFDELMNEYQCGELINSVDEIPQKVEAILKDYELYREQAYQAFERYYNLDKNFQVFLTQFTRFVEHPD